jgi:hypothetical protein
MLLLLSVLACGDTDEVETTAPPPAEEPAAVEVEAEQPADPTPAAPAGDPAMGELEAPQLGGTTTSGGPSLGGGPPSLGGGPPSMGGGPRLGGPMGPGMGGRPMSGGPPQLGGGTTEPASK